MKKLLCCAMSVLCAMIILPLTVLEGDKPELSISTITSVFCDEGKDSKEQAYFKIFNPKTEEITEISPDDYIIGVVAAEMPALYENEALKAQAVAAYSFAMYRKMKNCDKEYDLTTDSTIDQSFLSKTELKERWAGKFDEYYEKIKSAVISVSGEMLEFDGNPALAVYHAISFGKTEDCKNVWGGDIPYLVTVESPWDKLSPNYVSTAAFSFFDVSSILSVNIRSSENKDNLFKIGERTNVGTVKTVNICGKEYTGDEIRKAFSLRSTNFDVKIKEESLVFTVYGYGHGVGMSQYGANYMAKQGSSYNEILSCYYKSCDIVKAR